MVLQRPPRTGDQRGDVLCMAGPGREEPSNPQDANDSEAKETAR